MIQLPLTSALVSLPNEIIDIVYDKADIISKIKLVLLCKELSDVIKGGYSFITRKKLTKSQLCKCIGKYSMTLDEAQWLLQIFGISVSHSFLINLSRYTTSKSMFLSFYELNINTNLADSMFHYLCSNNVKYIKWIKYRHEFTKECMTRAAEKGNLQCIKYLYQQKCPFSYDIYEVIAKKGYLDCLVYLCDSFLGENDVDFLEEMINIAAINGRLDCVIYLDNFLSKILDCDPSNYIFKITFDLLCGVRESKNTLLCLEYLHNRVAPYIADNESLWDDSTFILAVKQKNKDTIKYLHTHGCKLKSISSIVEHGCISSLEYFYTHHKTDFIWNNSLCNVAAHFGQLDCLIFLHNHKIYWNNTNILSNLSHGYYSFDECDLVDCQHIFCFIIMFSTMNLLDEKMFKQFMCYNYFDCFEYITKCSDYCDVYDYIFPYTIHNIDPY